MRRLVLVFLASIFATSADGQTETWIPAAGLATGRVSVVKTNDVKPSVLWAGGSGGAYVSTDAGASWTLKTAGLPDPQHIGVPNRAMDVDRRNPDVVYATVGRTLYRTSDGGTAWSALGPPNASGPDTLLTLDPAHPGDFYFEFFDYDSICWGSTASPLISSCRYPFGGTFAIDPTNPDTLYAGSSLIKSTDGGKTWTYLRIGTVTFVRVDETGAVWIGGYDDKRIRIQRSLDGGETWTDLSAGLPAWASPFQLTIGGIAASPTNPSVLVAAVGPAYPEDPLEQPDRGFYRSVDGGAHWYRLGGHFEATTVAFAGVNGETLVGGTTKNGVVTSDANPPAAPISIERINPGSGSTEGFTLLMIYGSGFTPWTWVTVGGREATDFTFFDARTIRVRTPAHAAGLGDVVVHNADGGAAVLPGAFEFQDWAHPANDPASSCDSTLGLCLENGRFWVTVRRTGFAPSHPVPLSQKSGYFWFDFSPSVEVTVKILDGRTIDGHYWVHWSALTDEAFSLMVMDRLTMTPQVYEKAAGSAAAVIDKTTF